VAAASVAGARAIAAWLPVQSGRVLTQAANTAYAHGVARATVVGTGLLVAGAILCAILLPGTAAREPEAR
jgi:hypothetical protein